jgi:hypothetical protein
MLPGQDETYDSSFLQPSVRLSNAGQYEIVCVEPSEGEPKQPVYRHSHGRNYVRDELAALPIQGPSCRSHFVFEAPSYLLGRP